MHNIQYTGWLFCFYIELYLAATATYHEHEQCATSFPLCIQLFMCIFVHTINFHHSKCRSLYCPLSYEQAASSSAYSREVRHKKTKVQILWIPSLATLQPGAAWCLVSRPATIYGGWTQWRLCGDCMETLCRCWLLLWIFNLLSPASDCCWLHTTDSPQEWQFIFMDNLNISSQPRHSSRWLICVLAVMSTHHCTRAVNEPSRSFNTVHRHREGPTSALSLLWELNS